MTQYDEEALKKAVSSNHLASLKNYLYHSILSCLRTHQSSSSTRVELLEAWTDAHLLLEKGLVKQAQKQLEKAKKAASKYHFDILSLELNVLERRIVRQATKSKHIAQKKIEELVIESQRKLKTIQADFSLLDLYEEVYSKIRYDKENLEEEQYYIFRQPIPNHLSFDGRICYYLTNSMIANVKGKQLQKHKFLKELLLEFEEQQSLINKDYDYQVRYIACLNNFCASCFALNKLHLIPTYIEKLELLDKNIDSFRIKSFIFQIKYNFQLAYWIKVEEYETLVASIPTIESGIAVYGQNISANLKHTFYENFATAHLLLQQYQKASHYLSHIINTPQTEVKTRILLVAYRLELQILFAEQEYDVLNFRLIAFKRKFKNYRDTIDYQVATAIHRKLQHPDSDALVELYNRLMEKEGEEEIKKWLEQVKL
jgi:hypothetical protein